MRWNWHLRLEVTLTAVTLTWHSYLHIADFIIICRECYHWWPDAVYRQFPTCSLSLQEERSANYCKFSARCRWNKTNERKEKCESPLQIDWLWSCRNKLQSQSYENQGGIWRRGCHSKIGGFDIDSWGCVCCEIHVSSWSWVFSYAFIRNVTSCLMSYQSHCRKETSCNNTAHTVTYMAAFVPEVWITHHLLLNVSCLFHFV